MKMKYYSNLIIHISIGLFFVLMPYNVPFCFSLIYSNNFCNIITSLKKKLKIQFLCMYLILILFRLTIFPLENFRLAGPGL